MHHRQTVNFPVVSQKFSPRLTIRPVVSPVPVSSLHDRGGSHSTESERVTLVLPDCQFTRNDIATHVQERYVLVERFDRRFFAVLGDKYWMRIPFKSVLKDLDQILTSCWILRPMTAAAIFMSGPITQSMAHDNVSTFRYLKGILQKRKVISM